MEAEAYLNRLPMWANKKNSLKDIRIFLDQMGGPDRKIPAIHVAGTNGKGSDRAGLIHSGHGRIAAAPGDPVFGYGLRLQSRGQSGNLSTRHRKLAGT